MKLYFRLMAAGMRARLQYKWDFMVTLVLYAVITGIDFLTVAALLYRYHYINGWNIWEMAVLSGVAGSSFGLFRVFCAELNGLSGTWRPVSSTAC